MENGENINNIRYMNDTTLIADSESKLNDIVDEIELKVRSYDYF